MASFQSLEELRDLVAKEQGVLTVTAQELRDGYGKNRLGSQVRVGISKALKGLGLDHLPADIPDLQHVPVRVFRQGSPVADLIDAVLNPSAPHDEELRRAAGGGDSEVLRQVRELVCG